MLSSSSVRNWAIASITAGALVGAGFSLPWFFASNDPAGALVLNGWQLLAGLFVSEKGDLLRPGATPLPIILMLGGSVLLPLVAIFLLVIGVLGLAGKAARWMALTQIVVAWVGVVALVLGPGLLALLFYALANLDVRRPNAVPIPGVGVWLMVAGLLTALVSGIRFRRAGRRHIGETAPAS
ncbi:MAG TPA: hypothetical protein VF099_04920 [Ktedonobacterales bacterium]